MSQPPKISRPLRAVFARYADWYLRRHFHSMRRDATGWSPEADPASNQSWVVYVNHASWWDPLVCLLLHRQFFNALPAYAPIDERAVEKYAFFRKLGFFGVDPDPRSPRAAASFLRTSRDILAQPGSMLWITPQGRFADVRERPVQLRSGIGHLAHRVARDRESNPVPPPTVRFVPLAIEYVHWEERLPEILVRFGNPVRIQESSPADCTLELARHLEATLDDLAQASRQRQAGRFVPVLRGSSGVGGTYDLWRRLKAAAQGRSFEPRHGSLG